MEHTRKYWRYINDSSSKTTLGNYNSGRGQFKWALDTEGEKSEVEVGIMENRRNWFLLTYRTPLMDVVPIQKDSGTLSDTNSEYTLLSGKYYLTVDVGKNMYTENYSTSIRQG